MTSFVGLAPQEVARFFLVFARVLPIAALTPFLGGRAVPPAVRAAVGGAVALTALPFAPAPGLPGWSQPALLPVLLLVETARGFAVGFVALALFSLAESAGRALDVVRGANLAEVQSPALGSRASPLGQMTYFLTLLVFCRLDGPARFLAGVVDGFRIAPLGSWPRFESLGAVLPHVAAVLQAVLGLVLPGLVAALLVDVVFGALNRVAPALNAYFLALGGKSLAVIAMLALALGGFVAGLPPLVERTVAMATRIVGVSE